MLLTSKYFFHDVSKPLHLEVDQIYNLACPASPKKYSINPIRTLITGVYGAANMLALAHECGARILQASTSEVYGDPVEHPQSESYFGNVNPIGPRACYTESKRCAETLFFEYHRQHGLDIKIARIFNTYGPRMDANDGRVVSNFVYQALTGQDITIYGNGGQTRSFCYVTDMVDGLIALMNQSGEITGPINLGNPQECTIKELAVRIIRMTNSSSLLHFRPMPADDPKRRQPDIFKAKQEFNWSPKVDLEQGLWQTIDYFRSILSLCK